MTEQAIPSLELSRNRVLQTIYAFTKELFLLKEHSIGGALSGSKLRAKKLLDKKEISQLEDVIAKREKTLVSGLKKLGIKEIHDADLDELHKKNYTKNSFIEFCETKILSNKAVSNHIINALKKSTTNNDQQKEEEVMTKADALARKAFDSFAEIYTAGHGSDLSSITERDFSYLSSLNSILKPVLAELSFSAIQEIWKEFDGSNYTEDSADILDNQERIRDVSALSEKVLIALEYRKLKDELGDSIDDDNISIPDGEDEESYYKSLDAKRKARRIDVDSNKFLYTSLEELEALRAKKREIEELKNLETTTTEKAIETPVESSPVAPEDNTRGDVEVAENLTPNTGESGNAENIEEAKGSREFYPDPQQVVNLRG